MDEFSVALLSNTPYLRSKWWRSVSRALLAALACRQAFRDPRLFWKTLVFCVVLHVLVLPVSEHRPRSIQFYNEVFAGYQVQYQTCLGRKTYQGYTSSNIVMVLKPTNAISPRQPNPRKVGLEVPFLPVFDFFRGLGWPWDTTFLHITHYYRVHRRFPQYLFLRSGKLQIFRAFLS